jgi:RES domain-containing protein
VKERMSDYTVLNPTQKAKTTLSNGDYARVEALCLCIDDELDACFSSSVACCDGCVDGYIAAWPHAFRHDESFQRNKVDVATFYDDSKKVRKVFSQVEFQKLLAYVACPRCFQTIGSTVYPYELPFDVPEDWEAKQQSLADRAAKTPFLLLREPFAREVFDNLSRACSSIKSGCLPVDLFRGRNHATCPKDEQFLPPPPGATREGRYNHAGIPVLYLATNRLTCWRECGEPSSNFYVCRIRINKPMKIIDLAQSEELEPTLQALIFSSLMSAPSSKDSGWYQPQYVLTRFVADCVRVAGVQGIMYPSVRCGKGNNLAILDLKDYITWLHVSEVSEYTGR